MKIKGFRAVCIVAGCVLIAASLVFLVLWQSAMSVALKHSKQDAHTIRALIPEPQDIALEERYDNTMASLPIDGVDYVGLIEFPAHSSDLPVRAEWNERLPAPCRFDGSIYDGSLIIGATSQKGQYDFFRNISAHDAVFFTDMTGGRFSFEVSDILYRNNASENTLASENADLTIFIKNLYAPNEYIIVHCVLK